jgi:hypothetical protein
MTTTLRTLAAAALLMLAGCAGQTPAERLFDDTLAAYGDGIGALESVKDEATARAAGERLAKSGERVDALAAQLKSLQLPKEESDRLKAEYRPKMAEAGKKMAEAWATVKLRGYKVDLPPAFTGGRKIE